MARTRLVHPAFFAHHDLYQAEAQTGLPLRVAFAGLWCAADREGRFAWRPENLKLACLPFDAVDFGAVLEALATHGFVVRYADGYGCIPSWVHWQKPHPREAPSRYPDPAKVSLGLTQGQPKAMPRHVEGTYKPGVSVSVSVSNSDSTTNNEAADAARPELTPMQQVMGCLRRIAYAPDGKPPAGWSEARDGSIAKRLMAKGTPADELCQVIEGVALLRDDGELDWLPRGQKFTLRAVYRTRVGAVPVHTLALNHLDKRGQGARKRAPDAPGAPLTAVQGLVGDVLARIGGRAS